MPETRIRRVKRSRRRIVETSDYAQMMERMVKSYGRRVADGDPADLAELIGLGRLLDTVIAEAVHGQMAAMDISWADIAAAAGMTKQGAHKRWAKLPCGHQSTMAAGARCELARGHEGDHLYGIGHELHEVA